MSHRWRVVWTIARRDYVATVFSRLFLLFLLLPVIFSSVGALFGAIGSQGQGDGARPVVAVSGDAGSYAAIAAARARLAARLGDDALPQLVHEGGDAQAAPAGDVAAVLSGGLEAPHLLLGVQAPEAIQGQMTLLIEDARATRRLGHSVAPAVSVAEQRAPPDASTPALDHVGLAKSAQYAALILTIMLAGRLLSSFIEERSNKVIEILAAAVPVDAIFLGKLFGMLAFSLTCIVAWGVLALAGALAFAPGALHAMPAPAIGWWAFVPLVLIYFASSYVLFGAVMLGIGAQANSPADVQTLALPTTVAQLLVFGFASMGVARPDHWMAWAAAIFPWSSPLAMIARAAERPALWPHLVAIAWQAAWLALAIRIAAARFRRAVLKSGPVRRGRLEPSS